MIPPFDIYRTLTIISPGEILGVNIQATIRAKGIVKGNIAVVAGAGTAATGVVTGNYAVNSFVGIEVGPGSTVIGNTADDNQFGISASCRTTPESRSTLSDYGTPDRTALRAGPPNGCCRPSNRAL
jgi:hypothetical protein